MALTKVIGSGIGTVTNQFADANMSAGSVVQVVSTTKTDVFSHNTTTYADITGLTVNITPRASSSKILITGHITTGGDDTSPRLVLLRDSTAICISTESSGNVSILSDARTSGVRHGVANGFSFLDSPSTTSEITYKWQIKEGHGNATVYVNKTGFTNSSIDANENATSTITVMEIAG